MLSLALCALGHEAGHLIFMNIFGVKIDEITVGFLNFNIKYNKSNTSYKTDLFISLGGVAVNLLLFFCGYLFGNSELCFTNLILIIVNLLPIPSLDGANVISALMGCKSKKEEKILEMNQKKTNAKIKFEEKVLEKKKARNQQKIESHLALADARVEDALDDADIAITILSNDVQVAIENNGEDAGLILFKADNLLEEILLRTQLRIQIAKNELINVLVEVEEFFKEPNFTEILIII